MCGITGVMAFNRQGMHTHALLPEAVGKLKQRGPDGEGVFFHNRTALGHRRLSVIDISDAATQPMTDSSGRYTIVFNGEIFNFMELREQLAAKGISFHSRSDTEVLLNLYIREKENCLHALNGFFAFAVYDKSEESLFIARDRYGIKPLLYFYDNDRFIFASEMKALLSFGVPREIDAASLYQYLQMNYIPAPATILNNVKKLEAGHFIRIAENSTEVKQYYEIPHPAAAPVHYSYESASKKLFTLLEKSVQRRLISDVPLGCFLSGGIDSSVITALAATHSRQLNTFSIGYKDEPMFDETRYALLVAKKYRTNHTVFSLSNDDLYANMRQVLEYTDEPFADSSALAVHILSMHTRKHVTVALSGDGADELFGGYNKHAAELKARQKGITGTVVRALHPLWKSLPKSRHSPVTNKVRQLHRFSEGSRLDTKDRYWRWACFTGENDALRLISPALPGKEYLHEVYRERKAVILRYLHEAGDMNEVLYSDMKLVLQNDMLHKVDMMSMANSLEVRVPFLDYTVVDFVSYLPAEFKIDSASRKKILKTAFRNYLPEELFHRRKQGFEVPLLKWMKNDLRGMISDDLLNDDFVREQGVFNVNETRSLKEKLFSRDPGETHARVWGLIVFQYWWKKYIQEKS